MLLQTTKSSIEYRIEKNPSMPTILFLHGLGANQEQFKEQCAYFSQNYQVLTLNVRGHGKSTSSEPFTLAGCAQDVIDLLDAFDVQQFHFVGNSMGGNIGYELLKTFEDRLLSMTTFGTTAELNTSGSTLKVMTLTYKLLPMGIIASLAKSAGQTPQSKECIKEMMSKMKKETLLEIVPALAQFNYLDVISRSHIPFQIIKGTKDSEINNVLTSTIAAFEARGTFTLLELENVGHFVNLDAPEKFDATLQNFLQELG